MLELKKALENNNIDYRSEYVEDEFLYIETFDYTIEIYISDIDNKYHVGTFKDNEEDIKNEKNIKSIKAVLNYIDKFDK